jgi:hypothetical protein
MSGAIAGLAIGVGTATMSFVQAGKQKRMMEDAERAAQQAMAEVEKELTKNEYEALAIQKEPYEIAQDTLKSQASTELQAIREGSQRGVLAGSQRVGQGVLAAAGEQRTAMGKELGDLDKLVAAEESRKSDIKANLKLGEAQGAQQAMRDAQAARDANLQQGIMGVANVAQQGLSMLPDYGMSSEARDINAMQRDVKKSAKQDFLNAGGTRKEFRQNYNPDTAFQQAIGGLTMTPGQFKTFGNNNIAFDELGQMSMTNIQDQLLQMTPEQRQMISGLLAQ